jgi:hypothetical protein
MVLKPLMGFFEKSISPGISCPWNKRKISPEVAI